MEKNKQTKMDIFKNLLLLARPAAGKSEVIDFLKNQPIDKRVERFHIGEITVIDDFPFLWRWFEEDALLNTMGHNRIYTDELGYFKQKIFWDLLIHMINLEYDKVNRDLEQRESKTTFLIEFSRGKDHGGYQRAFPILSNRILQNASILYIDVSWEESLRKNRARFNPKKPDGILEHSVPDKKLKKMYYECDFKEISYSSANLINIREFYVPYQIMENEDDVTSKGGIYLEERLKSVLDALWDNKFA